MTTRDDDVRVRPGRINHGNGGGTRPQTFVGEVMRAAKRAGHVGDSFRSSQGRSRSRFGRGRRAAVSIQLRSNARRVVMKARVVRHQGSRFRSAPLPKHINYLKPEGVTRDGEDARMFDANSEVADERAFAERCKEDRHHFRFIVSPEDAAELENLRTFTRELLSDVEHDLGTKLDWVAVDHWNTDNPHVHVLIRGRADDGEDLVISRACAEMLRISDPSGCPCKSQVVCPRASFRTHSSKRRGNLTWTSIFSGHSFSHTPVWEHRATWEITKWAVVSL
jgi:hypothetical protein